MNVASMSLSRHECGVHVVCRGRGRGRQRTVTCGADVTTGTEGLAAGALSVSAETRGSDREEVGALGREAVAAGGAGQAAAQPRGGVLAGPAGVLAAGGEPLGAARPASRNEAGRGGWG